VRDVLEPKGASHRFDERALPSTSGANSACSPRSSASRSRFATADAGGEDATDRHRTGSM